MSLLFGQFKTYLQYFWTYFELTWTTIVNKYLTPRIIMNLEGTTLKSEEKSLDHDCFHAALHYITSLIVNGRNNWSSWAFPDPLIVKSVASAVKFWTKLSLISEKEVLDVTHPVIHPRRLRAKVWEVYGCVGKWHHTWITTCINHVKSNVIDFFPPFPSWLIKLNSYWPGSEKTAFEWQASSSSRIRLNTDPCSVHQTLSESRKKAT